MTHPASTADRPPTSKAVLYCFECGHESPFDGDWIVQQSRDCNRYDCPDCGTTITVRPRDSARAADGHTTSCYCAGD
ncbi:hypothetical protein [Natronorubrum sp. FCH18a]|uniref:hypothetical protein n=1 Tax=Natronorubrum sp. FCH18a TaxID=3447018 RepID=UPI003F514F68